MKQITDQVRVWFRNHQGQPLRTIEIWDEPVEALLCAEEILLDEDMVVETAFGDMVSSSEVDDSWPMVILPADEQANEALLEQLSGEVTAFA